MTELNPTATPLVYSTYLGGNNYASGVGIAVDAAGHAFVTGYTQASNFPTTSGAFQTSNPAVNQSAFVTQLNPTGTALVYSTYLGGNDNSVGNGIAVDAAGQAYVTGSTQDSNFPTTPGAFQTTNPAGYSAFIARFDDTTTTTLTSSATSITYGQAILLTAAIASVNAGDGTPTGGTVTFSVNGVAQTPVFLTQGVAYLSLPNLTPGVNVIGATYSGSAPYDGSSSTVFETVQAFNTFTTLTGPTSAVVYGQPFLVTDSLNTNISAGTVTFTIDGNPQAPVPVNQGAASLAITNVAGGTHVIGATYNGASGYTSSSAATALMQTVTAAGTSTALASDFSPSNAGQPLTYFATVTATAPSLATVTGIVQFWDTGSGFLGAATLSGGMATLTPPTLAAGTHTVYAVFQSNASFATSTSPNITQQVNPGPATHFLIGPNTVPAVPTEFPVTTTGGDPNGITAGPDGNLWFIEEIGDKIGRITPTGTVTEFPLPTASSFPIGITAGLDGNLWFTEQNNNKIGRISPSGTITEFNVPTAGSEPTGITAGPDGKLWFTELNGDNIGRVTLSGTATQIQQSITEFPVPTANSNPAGITAGPDGNLWFTENTTSKIGRITPAGTVTEFTVPTAGSGPEGITAGSDGNLWFTESNTNKIGRITPSGTVTEFTVPTTGSAPYGITAGADGNLWFTEQNTNKIGRITSSGTITEFPVPTASSGPTGITAGPDGNLWFTEFSGNNIGRIATGNTTAGNAFNFTVTALDAYNNTATGYAGTVQFTSSDGQAAFGANNVTLNPGTGTFSVTLKTAGSQTLTATDTTTSTIAGTSAAITVSPAAASHFAVGAPLGITAGVAFGATVTALDPYNNTVTGYTGIVQISTSAASATLPANAALTQGVGTFPVVLFTAGNQTVTATAETVTPGSHGTSGNIVVSPTADPTFAVTVPGPATAGTPITFTVTARDEFNNTATHYSGTVHFSSSDSHAAFANNNVTLTNGTGSFSATFATAGTPTLFATDTSNNTITGSVQVTVTAGTAHQLAFFTPPSNTPGTAAVNPAVQVAVEDTAGNVLTTDQTDSVTLAIATGPPGGAFTGGSTTTATVSNGIATFSNLHLTSAGSYTLTETATGGLSGPASGPFTITLVVSSFTATPTGFTVTFSQAFNPATLNLTGPTGTDGPVGVTLVGSGSIGPVSGSLYLDPTDTQLTFVKTVVVSANGLPVSTGSLPLGTYTVTLVSGSSALTTTNGVLLDGSGNGTTGNYTATFHVVSSRPAAGDVLLPSTAVLATAPDFARGPLTPSLTIAGSGGATESGNTVTITTTSTHGFSVGQTVTTAGVGLSGYDGTFTITSVPTATTFTYTEPTSGLAASGGGTANVPAVNVANNSGNGIPIDLTVLAPVQTVTFSSAVTTGTTGTFKLGFNSQTTANITVGLAIKVTTGSASTSGASESSTTVTIRTATATGLKVGESVTINGVGVAGYNGTFTVVSVPTTTSFTYTAASGLGLSGGGTWNLSGGAALATAMQNGLGALSVVGGTANVAVTEVGSTNAYTVTFAAAVANPNLITVAANAIAGAPTITVVNPNAPASVTDATLVLGYNANLLTITPGPVNASLSVAISGSGTAAQATITYHNAGGVNLGTLGSVDLGGLIATVPSTAPYKSKMLLHFISESLNGGALTAAGVDGYQLVAYQGDTDGNGSFSGNDLTLLNLVAGGTNPGFAAYRQVDPIVIGGLSSGTSISATDSGLMSSYLNGVAIPQVPDQTGVTPTLFAPGPDPTVSIPSSLSVAADGTVVVPVNLDDARPVGSTGLTQAELALTYDPAVFAVTAGDMHLGTIPSFGSGWTLSAVVDPVRGELAITLLSQTPIATSIEGSLVSIAFHQIGTAPLGSTPIRLVATVDPNGQGMFPTALFDTNNRFILSPAPTNGTADPVTGQVVLTAAVPGPTMAMARAAGTEPSAAASTAAVDRMVLTETAEVLVEAVPAMTVAVTEDNGTVPEADAPLARAVRSVAPPAVGAGTDVVVVLASGVAAQQAAGLGFQFGNTSPWILPVAGALHLADPALLACTLDETCGTVLPGLRIAVQPPQDNQSKLIGDGAVTALDWLPAVDALSLARARRSQSTDCPTLATGPLALTEHSALDQYFAAMYDEPEQGANEPSDE